jgi:hypothetical protein
MMLADAIDSAISEHAVYFLVTAYVESLHHFHTSLGLPERVIALPLGGTADLVERIRILREANNARANDMAAAVEAIAILEGALARLRKLAEAPVDRFAATRKAASVTLEGSREAISRAAHRLDQPVVAAGLERLAEPPDVHVDGALLDENVIAPDTIEQLRA